MRVLVCGGRHYGGDPGDHLALGAALARLDIDVLIHGCAVGADSMAAKYAADQGIKALGFMADWRKYGKAAGPMRNKEMLIKGGPDLVVAFPGGAGTAHMVRIAEKHGVPVWKPIEQPQPGVDQHG